MLDIRQYREKSSVRLLADLRVLAFISPTLPPSPLSLSLAPENGVIDLENPRCIIAART